MIKLWNWFVKYMCAKITDVDDMLLDMLMYMRQAFIALIFDMSALPMYSLS